MKEAYISPELMLVCFAPVQQLANSSLDVKIDLGTGEGEETITSPGGDLDWEIS